MATTLQSINRVIHSSAFPLSTMYRWNNSYIFYYSNKASIYSTNKRRNIDYGASSCQQLSLLYCIRTVLTMCYNHTTQNSLLVQTEIIRVRWGSTWMHSRDFLFLLCGSMSVFKESENLLGWKGPLEVILSNVSA